MGVYIYILMGWRYGMALYFSIVWLVNPRKARVGLHSWIVKIFLLLFNSKDYFVYYLFNCCRQVTGRRPALTFYFWNVKIIIYFSTVIGWSRAFGPLWPTLLNSFNIFITFQQFRLFIYFSIVQTIYLLFNRSD